jgi:hypothetical protein
VIDKHDLLVMFNGQVHLRDIVVVNVDLSMILNFFNRVLSLKSLLQDSHVDGIDDSQDDRAND